MSYKTLAFLVFLLLVFSNMKVIHHVQKGQTKTNDSVGFPHLYKKIEVPERLRTQTDGLEYGGDIRLGDLTGNGEVELIVYRSAKGNKQGATKPCFIGAFSQNGEILWQNGEGGIQPYRPGPVAIHDIDNDGQTEVICFFAEKQTDPDPFSMKGVSIQILNGKTGEVEKKITPKEFADYTGQGPNWRWSGRR